LRRFSATRSQVCVLAPSNEILTCERANTTRSMSRRQDRSSAFSDVGCPFLSQCISTALPGAKVRRVACRAADGDMWEMQGYQHTNSPGEGAPASTVRPSRHRSVGRAGLQHRLGELLAPVINLMSGGLEWRMSKE